MKTIFIASSTKAKPLAEKLAQSLEQDRSLKCLRWYDHEAFHLGEHTLTALLRQSGQVDFAVAFLTRDDFRRKEGIGDHDPGEMVQVPRDNVVFELGLFMGALDQGDQRCFIVSNIAQEALPSDLHGVTYIKMHQDDDLDWGAADVENARRAILNNINKPRIVRDKLGVIPAEEFKRLETVRDKGGELLYEPGCIAVIVNTDEPIEQSNDEFAKTVIFNLKKGLKYEYFLGDFEDNYVRATNLVKSIAFAGLYAPDEGEDDQLSEFMERRKEDIAKHLETMKQHLSIHFRQRPAIRFCVHNNNFSAARCYMHHDKGFVDWLDRDRSKAVAKELLAFCETPKTKREHCIFHSTSGYALNTGPLQDEILAELKKRLPRLEDEVIRKYCFGA